MKVLYLVNGMISLLICVFIILQFFKQRKNDTLKKTVQWFLLIFLSYIILVIYSLIWFLGVFSYNAADFNFIYSIIIFVQTLVLFKTVYYFKKDKKMLYLLLAYLLVLLSFDIRNSSFIILSISYLLTLVLSLNFVSFHKEHKNIGYTGITYAIISLILQILLFLNFGEILPFNIASSFLFFVFSFYFLRDLKHYQIKPLEIKTKEEPNVLLFIKYFIFIIAIINILLISTLGIHEFGHVAISKYYNCESRSIFYEKGTYPYSEIVCDNSSGKSFITLAGPLLPIILSLFLLIIGGSFVKSLSLIIAGFDILSAYKDLYELGLSDNIVFASTLIGFILLLAGIYLLAKSRMQENSLMNELNY